MALNFTLSVTLIIVKILGGFPFYFKDGSYVFSRLWKLWSLILRFILTFWFIVSIFQRNYDFLTGICLTLTCVYSLIPELIYSVSFISMTWILCTKDGKARKILQMINCGKVENVKSSYIFILIKIFMWIAVVLEITGFVVADSDSDNVFKMFLVVCDGLSMDIILLFSFELLKNASHLICPNEFPSLVSNLRSKDQILYCFRIVKVVHDYCKEFMATFLIAHFAYLIKVVAFPTDVYTTAVPLLLWRAMLIVLIPDIPQTNVSILSALSFYKFYVVTVKNLVITMHVKE